MMVVVFSLIYHSQQLKQHYEDLFGTPTALTFEHVAAMYDLDYTKVTTICSICRSDSSSRMKQPFRLIEVFTNREENVASTSQVMASDSMRS